MVVQRPWMRTRPIFSPGEHRIDVAYNDEMLNAADIDAFVKIGGDTIGLLESRPRFGRYQSTFLS